MGVSTHAMNRTTWAGTRAQGGRWAGLGLLLAITLFGHDLSMGGLAAPEERQFVPSAITPPAIQVVHVAVDTEGNRARGLHHQHALPEEPGQRQCQLARAAVAAANDLLDTTLDMIPNAIVPVAGWHDRSRPLPAVDITFPSSRDQRTLFQVFLI